ncbi:MAG: hypothetical protein ACI4NZ_02655 [Candidatus Enterousia sp.]
MTQTLPEKRETIAFAMLYNVLPADEIIDVDFNGYKILPFDLFLQRYNPHVAIMTSTGFWTYESIISDIRPRYVLVATYAHDKTGVLEIDNIPPQNMFNAFVNTLLYLRLFKQGDIQMGTFIVSYKDMNRAPWRNITHTNFVCFLPNPQYWDYQHSWIDYTLTATEAIKVLEFTNAFESKDFTKAKDILRSAGSFSRAHDTSDLFYKITNLVTVLENLLADDGKDGEISFKMRTRLVFLLEDESLDDFIRNIYDLRSSISHKGDIVSSKFVKKFKKTHGRDFSYQDMFEYINRLEEVCRQVLNYFLGKFINEDIGDVQKISTDLNKRMFTKLASNPTLGVNTEIATEATPQSA